MLSASWPKTNNIALQALQELCVNGPLGSNVTLPSGNSWKLGSSKMPICPTMPNLSTISLSVKPMFSQSGSRRDPGGPPGTAVALGWALRLLALINVSVSIQSNLVISRHISSYFIISLIKSNVSQMFEFLSNLYIYIQSNRSIYLSIYLSILLSIYLAINDDHCHPMGHLKRQKRQQLQLAKTNCWWSTRNWGSWAGGGTAN